MSKTFTSMDALKTAIQKEIRDAMTEVADQSLLNVHQNVDSSYLHMKKLCQRLRDTSQKVRRVRRISYLIFRISTKNGRI